MAFPDNILCHSNYLEEISSSNEIRTKKSDECISDKVLREIALMSEGAAGMKDACREALNENLGETAMNASISFALGAGLACISRGRGLGQIAARGAGVGFGLAFTKEIANHGNRLAESFADNWQSSENWEQNRTVARQSLGKFGFDTVLMSITGMAGHSAISAPKTYNHLKSDISTTSNKQTSSMGQAVEVPLPQPLPGPAREYPTLFPGGAASELTILRRNPEPLPKSERTAPSARTNQEVPKGEILDKITELESIFGIRIREAEMSLPNPWKGFRREGFASADKLVTRLPAWSELIGMEAALYRSAPSYEKGLTYHFFEIPKVKGLGRSGEPMTGGLYTREKIYFQPKTSRLPALPDAPTERGRSRFNFQELVTHETAHHGQYRYNLSNEKTLAPLAERLGWERVRIADTETWAFRAQGGQTYRFENASREWVRLKESEGGLPASRQDPARLSSYELRKRAAVRPISEYFDNPVEMITEGTTVFRLGLAHREHLLKRSPELYKVVGELDRLEISKLVKTNSRNPAQVRDIDGKLVPETAETKEWISLLESTLK